MVGQAASISSESSRSERHVHWLMLTMVASCITAFLYLSSPSFFLIGDTFQYLSMVNGEPTMAPFAYRIVVPSIVRWLPWSTEINFLIVSLLGSITTQIAGYFLFLAITNSPSSSLLTMCLLGLSYPIGFYLVEYGRVDPIANTCLVVGLLFIYRRSFLAASLVIALGALTKETVLFLLPILFISAVGAKPLLLRWQQLLWIAIPVISFIVPRLMIQPTPGVFTIHSWADLIAVWQMIWQLNTQEHGVMLRIGRDLIRAFGFNWVFAIWGYTLLRTNTNLRWICIYLLTVGVALCFIATDWSRMLGSVFPAIFIPVSVFISQKRFTDKGGVRVVLLIICAMLQVHLSFYRYGDMNREGQLWLLISIGAVFCAGSLICLSALRKVPDKAISLVLHET
jgi:hypothetical protein